MIFAQLTSAAANSATTASNTASTAAAETVGTATTRVTFEWGRLHSLTHWSHWLALIAVCVAVLWFVWHMYRRDSVELHPAVGWLLTFLRVAAFVGLLLVYLQPQWRTDEDRVINSKVLLLADTSLSMGLHDEPSRTAAGPNRAEQVMKAFAQEQLIEKLRQTHDVVVLRFDQDLGRVASFGKLPEPGQGTGDGRQGPGVRGQGKTEAKSPEEKPVDWTLELKPRGTQTQLGQALRQLISDERSAPISGIALFTDGGQNAGVEPSVAIKMAQEAKIPIFPVGVGSDRRPTNVRVSDLLAPARAYPGDSYTVTGYLQSQGFAGQSVTVELLTKPASDAIAADPNPGQVEASEEVTLGADGEVLPVKFELTPGEAGRRSLSLRVLAPPNDGNAQDDLFGPVDVEVIEHKTKVLLFAGGPSREYIFLRNQLRRDSEIVVDVLLQTARPGVSQDANKILDDFPLTREELYAYDCIVAFDPNWQELSADQVEMLEKWVGDQAGGLIVIPGPIHTDTWSQAASMAKIRGLYPVEFNKRFSMALDSRFENKEPWPLDFTRDGLEAEFLWLGDTASQSQQAWASFEGVYGYYAVRGPKLGATVYATYSDPRAASGDAKPVYMAAQFFGSGRVFYLGSSEMYRLRKHDEGYFEQFYTKLIRHVSQGRLLRGSSRGVLLVERDRYLLGNTVVVRAQLSNSQLEPLEAPAVPLEVLMPSGELQSVELKPIVTSPGTFGGQFNVYQEGAYRLELPVPETSDERLVRRIQVKVPDLERENPQRNDPLLTDLARATGGEYFVGVEAALGQGGRKSLVESLPDRRKTITLTATPESLWDNEWVMWGLVGILSLEWLIRRLMKLA
jgi:hypothetical protein